jgi:hypothetical protein
MVLGFWRVTLSLETRRARTQDEEEFVDEPLPLIEELRVFAIDARGRETALGPRDVPSGATRSLLLRPLRA